MEPLSKELVDRIVTNHQKNGKSTAVSQRTSFERKMIIRKMMENKLVTVTLADGDFIIKPTEKLLKMFKK